MKKNLLKMKNLKLSIKLSVIICMTCLILLLIEIAGRKSVYAVYDEQLMEKTTQLCIAYSSQLETEIERIEDISFSVIGDANLQETLSAIKADSESFYEERKNITNSLISIQGIVGDNASISIYLPDGSWVASNGYKKNLEKYVETAKRNKGKTEIFTNGNKIGVFREIRQIEGLTMKHLGVLFVMKDMNALMHSVEYNYQIINVVPNVCIFDGEECIYNSSTNTQSLPQIKEKAVLVDDQLVVPYVSSKLGWGFVLSVPYDEISESVRIAALNATILCVCMAVIVCMLSIGVFFSLLPDIKFLLKKFDDFSKGEIPEANAYPSYEGRTDEFGQLHVRFDRMMLEHQELTQKVYQSMVLIKDAQFRQLQQQIRPHFLFNTLSTIVWTAEENHDSETAKIASALGRILRNSFKNTDSLVTIREEFDLVRDYLYIQQIRYAERLSIEETVEEDILDAVIPMFSIQPLVENVIIHVVEKSLDPCVIKINGKMQDGVIEICVEDNGGELEEDILEKIESKTVIPKGNGVGLSNVDTRLKLSFSEEYGLFISNINGHSVVKICIPYKNKQDSKEQEAV